ncbi:subtilisin-like protease [Mycena alexandri]|uniref:Subtilisin-like protease n=1 Tax=Mycena alexandri TaxID=1745969 RepID=A0AAD6TJ05_9AGAR|nr:subtilisin-like protease [Mycena alexandri]
MRTRGIAFDIGQEYNTPDILIGAAIRLSSFHDVAKLSEIPGVKAIRPIIKVPAPKPVSSTVVKDPKASDIPDTYSTHLMTGVDKVHAQGNFGQGIKIGIIDTGIDYNHPLLCEHADDEELSCFGPGNKVIGGYDFVGDAFNGEDTPSPDRNPLDECNGHGTHVAGIIAASPNNTMGISGVAYNASLASYRIFGCIGYTSDDIISAALIMAYNQGMNILTLSLGSNNGWTTGTASVVASRIAAQGRVVTVAAGNNGLDGAWYSSDPGAGIGVIPVASVDNIVSPIQNMTVEGVDHDPIPYFMATPLPGVNGSMPIYATSTNFSQPDDACNQLPDSTPDLSPYIVVIHRGTCVFTQKLANVAAKGAKVAIIYNSDTGAFAAISVGGYKAVLISAADGKFLVEQFAAGVNITLNFPQGGAAFAVVNPDGGLISSFSTIGPTFDMYPGVALAAPGGNILSTLPVKLGSYALESGTSMSCPFAAGAAALMLKALGSTSPAAGEAVMRILQTTAVGVAGSHADGAPLKTVAQQGAGLIQVDRAIAMRTIVSPGQITLNDTEHFKANHTISITNMGNKTVAYEIRHVPAGTIGTIDANTHDVDPTPLLIPGAATISFSASTVTLHPQQTHHITATFSPPDALNTTLPVYSGFIEVVGASETLKVTYLGVAAALRETPVLDTSSEFFGIPLPALINAQGRPQEAPTNYTFEGEDFPFLLFRLIFGTALLRIDLVDKDERLTPSIPLPSFERRDIAAAPVPFTWWWTESAAGTSKIKTIGPIGEVDYVARSTNDPFGGYSSFGFQGTFANTTRINDGQYRALLRVLRVNGNRNNEEDYESWLSPQFGVVTPT